MKRYLIIFFIPLFFSCWLNPDAPANIFKCDNGNVQGENLDKCRKDVRTLYQMIILAFSGNNASVTKTEQLKMNIPTFLPESGVYTSTQSITLNNEIEESKIYYTLDGSIPTTSSNLYVDPILITQNTLIKAFAVKDGYKDSDIVNGFYSITKETTTSSTKSITSFYFANPAVIGTISGTSISLTVPYSTDLTSLIPTIYINGKAVSPLSGTAQNFTSPVTYTVTAEDGTTQSYIVTVSVAESTQVATPSFSPSAGTYYSNQSVSITISTNGATIFYTTDGTIPSVATGQRYSSPISVSGNGTVMTIKAIAIKSGMTDSTSSSATYTIDTTIPSITITPISIPFLSDNTGAINSKDVNWSSNRNGNYNIRTGSTSCNDGTVISTGTATTGNTNTVALNASSLSIGSNTIRICVVDSITSLTGSNTFTLTRDDTVPVVTPTPGSSSSSTAINVILTCSDSSSGCDKIVYTSNGTAPSISGTTGTVTAGTAYSTQLTPADNSVTTYQYLARDNAGNISIVASSLYTVDTSVATVSVNSITPGSTINETTNPQLSWQTNEAGTYTIRIGGTDCNNGTLATGTNISGSNLANTAITTTINSTALTSGANTIRICVANLVGNFGFTTQSITKDDVLPIAGNSGTITIANVTSTSLTLNWTKATDNNTTQSSLQYKVVRSLSNNISTATTAETNGTLVQDWTTDIATANVTSLSAGTTYYFNVLVKDNVGNKGIYTTETNSICYDWGCFTDNFDGTVRFVGNAGTFGGNIYTAQNLTFMKCSQGQVWNSTTNDCTGTIGSGGYYGTGIYWNDYGAGTYQLCSENGNNCNNGDPNQLLGSGFLNGSTSATYNTCSDLVFASYTDWRVPTGNELKMLIHCTNKTMPVQGVFCGNGNYALPTLNNLFPNTVPYIYWTSSTVIGAANSGMFVGFNGGGAGGDDKVRSYYVRCVRTGL